MSESILLGPDGGLAAEAPAVTAQSGVPKATPSNPYVGPRSLCYGENIYGRDRETRQLLELLIAERIVLLYSPSGAGKTSLIQAGLIPELEKEEFHVLPVIRVSRGAGAGAGAGAAPRNACVMSALLSLEQGVPSEQAIPAAELVSMTFADYLTRRKSRSETNDGTFLIFDQFEEILTIDPMNREAKIDFFNQVGDALRDLKRWALFAMREDHVAALDPYLRPIPTRLKATFRLDLLSTESARVAVQRPPQERGVEFTEEATTKLVDDLRQVAVQGLTGETVRQLGPYIEPVQLQVVCHRLWEKLGANVQAITEEHLAGAGNVDSALADYYAERVAQIAGTSGVKERVLREWFDRRLITESGLRSQVMVGSENTRELNAGAIQALVDVHLIRGEERRGVTWLELAHDRLVNPIRTDNAAWSDRNLSVLQHQAATWQSRGRSDALCLRGAAFTEALAWSESHGAEMTETEKEFLEVCQRNHDARQGKRLRWTVAALAVVLAIITTLAIVAMKQSKIATAQNIAGRAYRLLDERLDTALLLATEAHRSSKQPDTYGTLITAAYYNPRLVTYLPGRSPVNAVAFDGDGKQAATGDYDGNVALWNVQTHRPIEQYSQFTKDVVRAIAFSPDGRYMAASSNDNIVVLRDLKKGETMTLPQDPKASLVFSLAFSNDSKLLASGDNNGVIVVRNLPENSTMTLRSTSKGAIRSLSFKGTTTLAAGYDDGRILLWNRPADEWGPRNDLGFAHQHPQDSDLDSGPRDKDVETDSQRSPVRCLMVSPDGKYLAAGRSSGAVDLYDLSLSDPSIYGPSLPLQVTAFGQHDGLVNALAFAPDSKRLITVGNDGTLRLWEVPSMKQVGPPFTGHVGRVFGVAFSPDNRTVASGGEDRSAILWDTSMRAQPTREEKTTDKFSIGFSHDGQSEAVGYAGGKVFVEKLEHAAGKDPSEKELTSASEDKKFVPLLTFSGDGLLLASSTADGKVRVDNLNDAGSVPWELTPDDTKANENNRITAIALNKNGSLVAAALGKKGKKPRILIWKVATHKLLLDGPLECAEGEIVFTLQFSPGSTRLASGGSGQLVSIWTLAGSSHQTPVTCRAEHTGSIRDVAFSPDGKIFATASGDTTLILWDAFTGAQIAAPFTGHQAPVVTATFSPNGKWLASGSADHSVILWNVEARQRVAQLVGHTDTVRTLAFSPDGRHLYSGSFASTVNAGDGGLKRWELDPSALEEICRQRANRNLSRTEWNAYMRSGRYHTTWPKLPVPGEELRRK